MRDTWKRYIAKTARLSRVSLVLAITLALASCKDPSESTVSDLVGHYVNAQEADWCLNPVKIKSTTSNLSAFMNQRPDLSVPVSDFPLVLAEERFVAWTAQDKFIISLLIGGGFITVYSGGYAGTDGRPGAPLEPRDPGDVSNDIIKIQRKGALFDLTDKGKTENVWDPANGFCLHGRWHLEKILGWTDPAPDNQGRIVSHIKALDAFLPVNLGGATRGLNPMSLTYTSDGDEYTAVKFNDGWRLQ